MKIEYIKREYMVCATKLVIAESEEDAIYKFWSECDNSNVPAVIEDIFEIKKD